MSLLTAWDTFYTIVGSSAGALTGLTFVVISLVMGISTRDRGWGVKAFTTPTAVLFGAALLISAIFSAPWRSLVPVAVMLGLCGAAGVVYSAVVVWRLRQRGEYEMVREDWLWFALLPLVAYAALAVLAFVLPSNPAPMLFGVAAVTLVLLFVGIRNAWDVVTYLAIERPDALPEAPSPPAPAEPNEPSGA